MGIVLLVIIMPLIGSVQFCAAKESLTSMLLLSARLNI